MKKQTKHFLRDIEQLKSTLKVYYERIVRLEDAKYDLEYLVRKKDYEVRKGSKITIYTARLLIDSLLFITWHKLMVNLVLDSILFQ